MCAFVSYVFGMFETVLEKLKHPFCNDSLIEITLAINDGNVLCQQKA